jgi:hypothetical protein
MTRTVGNTTRRWLVSIVLAVGLLLGGVAFSAPAVSAANPLHVTSCADSGANTLRDAIAAAAPGGTIVFDQNCTIVLASTLTLAQGVTIDGTGHTVVLDGGCTFSNGYCQSGGVTVFVVNSGVAASLSTLTIQHGAGTFVCLISVGVSFTCGGAIGNVGTLTVTNCTLTGNSTTASGTSGGFGGGAIYNGGTMTLTNSAVTGNTSPYTHGGGIYNPYGSTLAVTNSTLSGNIAADSGGGIISDGMLTVTNSTLSGNTAYNAGGAIDIEQGAPTITNSTISGNSGGKGGGIDVDTLGTLTVTNSTIGGNTAATNGGGIYTNGRVTVTNDTISGNTTTGSGNTAGVGGGIDIEGNYNVTLTNTIVAGNTASASSDLKYSSSSVGRFVSGGHNLIGIDCLFLVSDTSDQCGTRAAPLNPLLGTLGANGGPTRTMALRWGSPAIGAADPTVCANASGTAPVGGKDQRGFARPAALCAIGAFEPLISVISPSFGLPSGGTTVTLTGAGYTASTTVSLGGAACMNVRLVDTATLICTNGAHAAGAVDVVVTVNGISETAPAAYAYGVANPLPGPKPLGGFPEVPPNSLPGARPAGTTGGSAPNPLPAPRP